MLRDPFYSPRSLGRNFAWVFVGNVALALSQWFVFVALVKWGSATAAGQFGIALAISGPIVMLANLNLRALQATDVDRRFQFADYYWLRFLTSLLAGLTMVLVGECLHWVGSVSPGARACIWSMALSKFFESQSDVVFGSLQQKENMDGIGKSQVLKSILVILGVGWVAYATGNAAYVLLCMALIRAACFYVYDLPVAVSFEASRLHWNPWRQTSSTQLLRLFWMALPLGIVMLLHSLNTNVPRYFLIRYLDEDAVGIFLGLTYLPIVVGRVFQSLGQAASPRLSRFFRLGQYNEFRGLLVRLFLSSTVLGLLITCISYWFGDWILRTIYAPEFARYSREFVTVTLAAAVGFTASFMGVGMTAMGHIRRQPWILGCVLSVQAVFCWWAIPRWGIAGAAASLIAAHLTQLGLMGFSNFWELRLRSPSRTIRETTPSEEAFQGQV